jgi:hypothetical protein
MPQNKKTLPTLPIVDGDPRHRDWNLENGISTIREPRYSRVEENT